MKIYFKILQLKFISIKIFIYFKENKKKWEMSWKEEKSGQV